MTEWIEPVTNRTGYDVTVAKSYIKNAYGADGTLEEKRACLNVTDINRIENDVEYLSDKLGLSLVVQEWVSLDIPTVSDKSRIISNVQSIVESASTYLSPLPTVPTDLKSISDFNRIEEALRNVFQALPEYDETKIAIIQLDENDNPTGKVDYVDTTEELYRFLGQTTTNYPYEIRVGSETGITKFQTASYGDSYFFARNTNLVSIVLPESFAEIGSYTFQNCTNLRNVEISNGLNIIWTGAFEGCTGLTEIFIPNSTTYIVNYAFRNTSGLTIYIDKLPNTISGSPWSASNATVIWRGLSPFGASWLLYGKADDAVMEYRLPGIYLHSPSRGIAFNFTCAESPEKVDFTRIKNVRAYGSFVSDPNWNLLGGIAALPYTHSTRIYETITATKLVIATAGSSYIDLDCTGIGGSQLLLLYADIGAEMTFTQLEFTNYPDADVTDLSEAVWELRNFQYEATTVITCNQTVTVPAGMSNIAVHSQLSGGASKSCVVFLDTNGDVVGYGDGWDGTEQDTDHLCSHRQSIPAGTVSVVIAVGYAPNMTTAMTPQEMARCIVCFD